MNASERLIIPFRGLNDGKHEFEFSLNDNFFQALDYSEFEKGNIQVNVLLDKKSTHLLLEIDFEGHVNVMCDRCLDMFDLEVTDHNTLIVKFSGNPDEDANDEIMIISPDEYELDITHYIYESVCLSLPYHRYHPENGKGKSGCNKEMMKKLRELGTVQTESEPDPRWEKLKNLNNN